MSELAVPSAVLAFDLAADLHRSGIVAVGLAADLHNRTGLAMERDLSDVIGNVRAMARDLADAGKLARILGGDRNLNKALGGARSRAASLASELAAACVRDRATRNSPLDLSLTLDCALAGTRAYADGRDRARIGATAVAQNLAIASDLARDFARDLDLDSKISARPARPAARLACTAACLLPRRDRVRYDLEYQSELADLASVGVSRQQQLRHAARLLARAPLLRLELAVARHRVAG